MKILKYLIIVTYLSFYIVILNFAWSKEGPIEQMVNTLGPIWSTIIFGIPVLLFIGNYLLLLPYKKGYKQGQKALLDKTELHTHLNQLNKDRMEDKNEQISDNK